MSGRRGRSIEPCVAVQSAASHVMDSAPFSVWPPNPKRQRLVAGSRLTGWAYRATIKNQQRHVGQRRGSGAHAISAGIFGLVQLFVRAAVQGLGRFITAGLELGHTQADRDG